MNILKILVVFLILYCELFKSKQDISLSEETIERPNWGAMFHNVGTILNGISKYKHTFAIPWPKIVKPQIKSLICNIHIIYKIDCDNINTRIQSVRNEINVKIEEIIDSIEKLKKSIGHITINGIDLEDIGKRRRKRNTGHALGDDYCDKISGNDDDSDSSLLGSIGNVFSDLFGTPTNGDIKAMASHICNQAKLAELEEKEIHQANDRLTSMSNVLDKRITNIRNGIISEHKNIEQMQISMNRTVKQIDATISDLEKRIIKIETVSAINRLLTDSINRMFRKVDKLSSLISKWSTALNTITTGYLDPFFVSSDDINNVLDYIGTKLLSRYGDIFQITHKDPQFYYLLKDISYSRTEEYLMITVNFPIHSTGGLLTVYRFDRLPVALSADDKSSTKIDKNSDLPSYIALTSDKNYYIELLSDEYNSCKGETLKICPSQKALRRSLSKSCLASLFFDSADDILKKCKIVYENKTATDEIAVLILPQHYLFHGNSNSTDKWTLNCMDAIHGKKIQSLDPCNSCIIKMPCHCSLQTPFHNIDPIYSCLNHSLNDETITYKYGLNLPMIHSLFKDTDLSEIKGNILRENKKWNIALPVFDIRKSSDWSDVVAKDEEYTHDFHKLIIQHKNKTVTFATKADALLKKAEDFSDLAKGNLNDMVGLLGGAWFTAFLNPQAMFGGISISLILSISSIAFTTYVCCSKVRH